MNMGAGLAATVFFTLFIAPLATPPNIIRFGFAVAMIKPSFCRELQYRQRV
jgi:hypothetical protein